MRVMRAQRLQDNSQWPNALVIKLTAVEPALRPPVVSTTSCVASAGKITFTGNLLDMGDAASLPVGFEYRAIGGDDTNVRSRPWVPAASATLTHAGTFTLVLDHIPAGSAECHAFTRHPMVTIYGADQQIR